MHSHCIAPTVVLAAFLNAGCGCDATLKLTGCVEESGVGRRDETQLRCECAIVVRTAPETWTSNEDVSGLRIDVCLPPKFKRFTANPDQLAAIELMTQTEYADALQAYCENQVATALTDWRNQRVQLGRLRRRNRLVRGNAGQ